MNRALLTLIFAALATGAGAQGLSRVTEELARAGFASGARIEVRYGENAEAAIRNADHTSGRTTVMAYGVSLFRDNSQNAGSNAAAVKAKFADMYPDINVRLSYENPWFKVEAGPFVDRIDAEALRGRVASVFRTAVVVQQEVSLLAIITTEMAEPSERPLETEE